jgi:hypothetical protein
MKTLFSLGFQSNHPFTVRHPSLIGAASLGRPIPLRMGQETSEFEHVADAQAQADAQANADLRAKLTASIAAGTKKLATVRSWIASRIDQDPMLLKTFREKYISDNFWGYDDMVTKDQYYVDLATQKIASSDPINWDFSEEMLGRIDEWNKGIDIMYAAMQEYGGLGTVTATPVKAAPVVNPKTGIPVKSSIAPGATVKSAPPSSGISTNTLLVGGGIAAAALAVIMAMRA